MDRADQMVKKQRLFESSCFARDAEGAEGRAGCVLVRRKPDLGLDPYEGRSYPGWNHHVSVVLSCHAFVVAERDRTFPPCARRGRRGPWRPEAAQSVGQDC